MSDLPFFFVAWIGRAFFGIGNRCRVVEGSSLARKPFSAACRMFFFTCWVRFVNLAKGVYRSMGRRFMTVEKGFLTVTQQAFFDGGHFFLVYTLRVTAKFSGMAGVS